MSVILICGAPAAPLTAFHKTLVDCRMLSEARPGLGSVNSMAQWMEKFFSKPDAPPARPLRPGRAWELAASEIFLANIDAPAWGWADARNLALLDFWREFDSDISFLMLVTPPEQYLASAQFGSAASADSRSLLAEWRTATEAMLAFYYRHPSQAVLVDARAWQKTPGPAARALVDRLSLSATLQEPAPLPQPDGLMTWLSRQIAQADPATGMLWDTVCGLLPADEAGSALDAEAALKMAQALHRKAGGDFEVLTKALATEKANRKAEVNSLRKAASEEKVALTASRDTALSRGKELAAKLDALNKSVGEKNKKQDQTLARAKSLEEENGLLLGQLHQVQEELEHYFLKQQEESSRADKSEKQFQKLLACYPHHVQWQELRSLVVNDDELFAHFLQLEVGAGTLPAIALRAKMLGGRVLIRAQAVDQVPLPWADPAHPIEGQYLDLDVQQVKNQLPFAQAQHLGAAHWKFCCGFPVVLQQVLARDGKLTPEWETGLKSLHAAMLAPLPLWRMDRVTLRNEQRNSGYEHLWLELHNAEFLGRFWPVFGFRLGAADVRSEGFSTHPRLEFPEYAEGPHQFEKWLPDTNDDYGSKFELRFELTHHDIDVAAWNRLSGTDHVTVASILESLPRWLASIGDLQPLRRPVADWQELSRGTLGVLVRYLEQRRQVQAA